mgnify:FL=1
MPDFFCLHKPVSEPVYVFLILLLIIFFTPKLLKFARIPGIVGFILAGVALGPNGFNIIASGGSIELFSTIGLLYIMFLIGLEIDLLDFRKNRSKVMTFGALTFFVPLITGFILCFWVLQFDGVTSLLLASMFSAHTMISYPIVSKLGLSKHRITTIVAGGTIITDTAVLLLLAVIINTTDVHSDPYFWIKLGFSVALLFFILFWLFPRISRWLFKKLEGDGGGQYILLLIVLFSASFLAKIAGIEAMIGAFLAGIAMNRLIPPSSSLMNRTVFIGNTLFIPFFLISVGMLVNIRVFIQGSYALGISAVLITIALFSKYLAALLTQKIFRYSAHERNLIFGLSASRAAATIALVLVGYNSGIFDIYILNGTIAVVFITCLVSGFVTEHSGRKLALSDPIEASGVKKMQRILVPLSNPATMRNLLNFAVFLKDTSDREPIYPLSVIVGEIDSPSAQKQIQQMNQSVETFLKSADRQGVTFFPATRVDLNVANGINRAIKELRITQVVLGWNGKVSTINFFFGSLLEGILPRNPQMMAVVKIDNPLLSINRLVLVIPPNAEFESGYQELMESIARLARQISAKVLMIGNEKSIQSCQQLRSGMKSQVHCEHQLAEEIRDYSVIREQSRSNDLLVFISARPRTLSYSNQLAQLPRNLSKYFADRDFVILYPEQSIDQIHDDEPQESLRRKEDA